MYIVIDNQDSFVYNLVSYMRILERDVRVISGEKIVIEEIDSNLENVEGIIISPGPGKPDEYEDVRVFIQHYAGSVPILGVCLGHQMIGSIFGASVIKGKPMHGKVTELFHNEKGIFNKIENPYRVTRYHSLIISKVDFPEVLDICAVSDTGDIMAIKHKKYPIYGVQFHPEALLSENGIELLQNFIDICKLYKDKHME